jgi:hypothetical protein
MTAQQAQNVGPKRPKQGGPRSSLALWVASLFDLLRGWAPKALVIR